MGEGGDVGTADEEFDRLYQAERDGLFRLALLICGDRQRAEDAVADAFVRVLPWWRRGIVERPAHYLRRALVNELTSGFRRRTVARRHADRQWGDDRGERTVEVAVSDRDTLRRALSDLSAGQRAALALRFYEDMTEADVAAVLGVSVGTVKSRVARALDRLRLLLDEEATHA